MTPRVFASGRGAHQAMVYGVDERETQTRKRELLADMDPRVLERTVFRLRPRFGRRTADQRRSLKGQANAVQLVGRLVVPGRAGRRRLPRRARFRRGAREQDRVRLHARIGALRRCEAAGGTPSRSCRGLQGEPWTFGRAPDEAKDWLAGLGWTLTENVWFVDAMRRRAWRAFSGGESRSPSARAV
jgi:O-methyltransferase involved in polyketide biosynthesis